MKKIIIYIGSILLLSINIVSAQSNAHFTTSGTIEFEKSVNMFAVIKKQINKDNEVFYQPMYDAYVKNQPQFKKLKSTLSFSDNKTMFVPIEEESPSGFYANNPLVIQNNTIFTDVMNGTYTCQKKVFEDNFLIKDTTRKIHWKITDETREIAGYTCRRANALVLDSVYVVAFYCDQIPVSGGPECFSGLPGMILGVALPHENVTWFATKITEGNVDAKAMLPPKKGKPVNNDGFKKVLEAATKDWGLEKDFYLKAFSL